MSCGAPRVAEERPSDRTAVAATTAHATLPATTTATVEAVAAVAIVAVIAVTVIDVVVVVGLARCDEGESALRRTEPSHRVLAVAEDVCLRAAALAVEAAAHRGALRAAATHAGCSARGRRAVVAALRPSMPRVVTCTPPPPPQATARGRLLDAGCAHRDRSDRLEWSGRLEQAARVTHEHLDAAAVTAALGGQHLSVAVEGELRGLPTPGRQ